MLDYMTLFPGFTRDKPRFAALAVAVLSQVYDLIALIPELDSGFSVAHAVGVQLDALGASVSIPRQEGWDDETYRNVLLRKLSRNQWLGTNDTAFDYVAEGETFSDNSNGSVTAAMSAPVEPGEVLPIPIGIKAV